MSSWPPTASPEFSFGVSRAHCSQKRGDYVRLFPARRDPPVVDRRENPRNLDLSPHDFTDVLSHEAKWQAHTGVLEAHGLRAVRAAGRHHFRAPCPRRCKSFPWRSLEGTLFVRCFARIAASSGSNSLSSRYSSPLGPRAKRMHAGGRSLAGQEACACQAQASGMTNIVESQPPFLKFIRDSC